MAPAATKRRSVRQAAGRKRSVYTEPDTDDDFDYDESPAERELTPAQQPSPKRQRTSTRQRRPQTRSSKPSVPARSKPSRAHVKPVGKPRKPNTQGGIKKRDFSGPSDKIIPAWTSLPIDILREVFAYACMPIHEQTTTASANVGWLIRAARTCRAFATPALEAYYQSPSLLSNQHPHDLLELLRKEKNTRYLDYNRKVQSLRIDVQRLAYTASNKPLFDISTLVPELPQLHHLEIIHPRDSPPFRPLKVQKWHYPRHLFQTLEQHGTRLKSWRWNRDMIPIDEPTGMYGLMVQTHTSKSFETIENLVVCGYGYHDSAEPAPSEDGTDITAPGLATSISLLPNVKSLTFISCEVIMDKFLERLPKNLERLNLTNCLELTSDMLREFLAKSGMHLKELILDHNPALNLAFLPGLKSLCPRLEVLTMDLRYYSERINSNDAEPLYDELLAADDTPTWPVTLRRLEFTHLQRCSAEASQNFFGSLVNGAADLPNLRHLVIQAHINIPWRDRAGFRDQWIERLQRVFLRRNEPPNPLLGSLRQFRLWKQAQADGRVVLQSGHDNIDDPNGASLKRRKASFVNVTPAKHTGDTDVYSDSSPVKRPQRRSKRVAESQASVSASPHADESESEDTGDEDDWRKRPEKFIQGLCDVVDIRIDNQRPRENQFTEGDFLDSEVSGDEDWNEDAEVDDEEQYAW